MATILPELAAAPHCEGKFVLKGVSIVKKGNDHFASSGKDMLAIDKPLKPVLSMDIVGSWCKETKRILLDTPEK